MSELPPVEPGGDAPMRGHLFAKSGRGCGRPCPVRHVTRARLAELVAQHKIDAILRKHGLEPQPVASGPSD